MSCPAETLETLSIDSTPSEIISTVISRACSIFRLCPFVFRTFLWVQVCGPASQRRHSIRRSEAIETKRRTLSAQFERVMHICNAPSHRIPLQASEDGSSGPQAWEVKTASYEFNGPADEHFGGLTRQSDELAGRLTRLSSFQRKKSGVVSMTSYF